MIVASARSIDAGHDREGVGTAGIGVDVGFFATTVRRTSADVPGAGLGLGEEARRSLPAHFEAVGEALASGTDPCAACAVVGRRLSGGGVDLGEALHGLRLTFALISGSEPDFRSAEAISLAWSEETLAYVHQLSCEDPLTGLASSAHVRARLSEIYRGAEQGGRSVATSHALVVIDLPTVPEDGAADPFTSTWQLVREAEHVRAVFSGEETLGRLGPARLVVLTQRGHGLGRQVAGLRDLILARDLHAGLPRIWIEGLPASNAAAAAVLDELSRT